MKKILDQIEQHELIRFLYQNNKKLALFGASKMAAYNVKRLCGGIYPHQVEVAFIIDNNRAKQGTFLEGIPVISYEEFQKNTEDVKVLITNRKIYQSVQDIKRAGVAESDIYYPNASFAITGAFLLNDWVYGNNIYTRILDLYYHKQEIMEVYDLLADEKSKRVMEAVVKFRLEFNTTYISGQCDCFNSDYFGSCPFELSDSESFVDIGALNGDSSLEFLSKVKNKYEHLYVMEPNPQQLGKASDNLFTLEEKDKITFYNFAISDYDGVVAFDGFNINSNSSNQTLVRTFRIDSLFDNKKVTIIKMDIEGAEKEALHGGIHVIQTQKPKLFVCVYHISEDLWEIPLMIKKMNPDYQLYLRQDSPGVLGDVQTVCYAK